MAAAKEKTKTIEISLKQDKGAFTIFKQTGIKKQDLDFSGILVLRQLLSNEKARILYTIKVKNPTSMYDLAKILERNFKAVRDDIKFLERLGFIELIEEKTKNRIRHVPKIVVDKIILNLSI